MSVDLGVFYTERPHSDEDAAERYMALCSEEDKRPWLGKIVTAPTGIRVAETETMSADLAREKKGGNWPWIEFIDKVLAPHGFERRRQIWRRDGRNTIAALELGAVGDGREIRLYIWFKAKGDVDPAEVGRGGRWYFVQEFRDVLPKKMKWALSHVMEPTMYHAGLDPADAEKRPKWEATLCMLLENHALPWFDEIEADPRDYYGWGRFRKWLMAKFGRRDTVGNET